MNGLNPPDDLGISSLGSPTDGGISGDGSPTFSFYDGMITSRWAWLCVKEVEVINLCESYGLTKFGVRKGYFTTRDTKTCSKWIDIIDCIQVLRFT